MMRDKVKFIAKVKINRISLSWEITSVEIKSRYVTNVVVVHFAFEKKYADWDSIYF